MNENNNESNELTESGNTVAVKRGFLARLDNFWYHYKWHSLIALFLVLTVTVCTLQMCSRESYDLHVLYAGEHGVNRQNIDGDRSEYSKIVTSLESEARDFNDDGEVLIAFKDLYILDNTKDEELDESDLQRAYNDGEALRNLMLSSDYYVCFISSKLYNSYITSDKEADVYRFVPLTPDLIGTAPIEYYDDTMCAIKLSSLKFYKRAGINKLPEDTVLCLRRKPINAGSNQKKAYNASVEYIKEIVSLNK